MCTSRSARRDRARSCPPIPRGARDGTAFTGDGYVNGVDWLYLHSGCGWGRITAVAGDGLSCTVEVLSRLPDEVVGNGNGTTRWQLGAWSDVDGWPEAVAFFAGRLVLARGPWVWFSATDDYHSFRDRSFGEVKADDGIAVRLDGRGINRCQWLEDVGVGLLVGTDGGEWLIRRGAEGSVFGAVTDAVRNVRQDRQSSYGCMPVPPVLAHDRTLVLGRTGRVLRELAFRLETDKLGALDLGLMAEHRLRAGVRWMAWQGEPDNTLWLGLADGSLSALTFRLRQLRAELGPGAPESLQGRRHRVSALWVRLLDTGQTLLAAASATAAAFQLFQRSSLTPMGAAPPLFSGEVEAPLKSSWDDGGGIVLETDEPLPVVVLAIGRRLHWGDR